MIDYTSSGLGELVSGWMNLEIVGVVCPNCLSKCNILFMGDGWWCPNLACKFYCRVWDTTKPHLDPDFGMRLDELCQAETEFFERNCKFII